MIPLYSYQNPINERYVCENNYLIIYISIVNELVIFYWRVSRLLDFDIADMISFDIKYLIHKFDFTNFYLLFIVNYLVLNCAIHFEAWSYPVEQSQSKNKGKSHTKNSIFRGTLIDLIILSSIVLVQKLY